MVYLKHRKEKELQMQKINGRELTKKQIEKICHQINWKCLGDIIPKQFFISNSFQSNKGAVGQLIETVIFNLPNNNIPLPDFSNAGIELKIVPVKLSKGKYVPKERVKIGSFTYTDLVKQKDFYSSHVFQKCKQILFIFILHSSNPADRVIVGYTFWNLSEHQEILKQIKTEHYSILNKVNAGLAHTISEKDTMFLGASTCGGKAINNLVEQPFSPIKARKRAFCFKKELLRIIINDVKSQLKPLSI